MYLSTSYGRREENMVVSDSSSYVVCTQIFGPVTSATTFQTVEEAIAIANDTEFGLGAGVWTRDAHQAYQVPRAIEAGRVWVNCCTIHTHSLNTIVERCRATSVSLVWLGSPNLLQLLEQINCSCVCFADHAYPAHAPFGGYKKSGFGRETHKMMLSHYRQTKNMLISYDENKLGFF